MPWSGTARTYRALSGLTHDYSFFGPRVSSGVRVGFVLDMPKGLRFIPLSHAVPEVARRYDCIAAGVINETSARQVLARSWAAAILSAYPKATRTTVIAQVQSLPTPERYRLGERPTWDNVYVADFQRRQVAP